MGRPTKYRPETVNAILERLRAGATRRAAAESLGVDETTFSNWLVRFKSLKSDVDRAEADAELRNVLAVERAASGYEVTKTTETILPDGTRRIVTETTREQDWRAAESWLKRRRPEDWGDKVEVRALTDEQVLRGLNRAAGQRGLPARPSRPRLPEPVPGNGDRNGGGDPGRE